MAKREKSLKYEQALDQVEQIIDQIESGEVGLEQAIEQSREGMKLIQHCRGILDRAEKQIAELLDAEEDGEDSETEAEALETEPVDPQVQAEADDDPPF